MVQFDNVTPIRILFCLLVDENYQEKKGKEVAFTSQSSSPLFSENDTFTELIFRTGHSEAS